MLRVHLLNDGTGDDRIGNYTYVVYMNSTIIAAGRVDGHHRTGGWIQLLKDLVKQAKHCLPEPV